MRINQAEKFSFLQVDENFHEIIHKVSGKLQIMPGEKFAKFRGKRH